jgi:two-component system sensor histidine kinase KdpD
MQRLRRRSGHGLLPFLATVGAVGAATAVAAILDPHVSLTVVAMIYLVGVMVVSYRFSPALSAISAVLSVLGLNVFFVHPRGTLAVESTEHFLTLAAMLGAALLISGLSSRLRGTTEQAVWREQRARNLQGLAARLAGSDDESEIIDAVSAALKEAFGDDIALALDDRAGVLQGRVPGQDVLDRGQPHADALVHCRQSGQVLGPGTGRWDGLSVLYVPVRAGASVMGALAIPSPALLREDREHAQAIADLLAGAMQRIRHASEAVAARAAAQSQQLRNTLLAAVSHDFRTPLASIIGAASSLQRQRELLPPGEQDKLIGLIEDEALHLTAMTDNTLQWVRLNADTATLRLDWESVEEIVGSTLSRIRRRDPARRIQARVATGLPLVRADAVLVAQLLTNLLDNALKYSDGPVQVDADAVGQWLQIDVRDRGIGVDPAELDQLFDTFFRGAGARKVRGAGLGLAVSRAIAVAHGGTLDAEPREGGGSLFRLRLPLAAAPAMPVQETA